MRRHFIKKPVMATTSFWSTDVKDEAEIRSEIQKALDAGTTFEDVDDYLNKLYNLEIIDDETFSELINWAAPFTTNSTIYTATDEASTSNTSFWSTRVNSHDDIKAEIQKAIAAGIIDEDIDDYLDELNRMGIIDEDEMNDLMDWGHDALDAYCNRNINCSTEDSDKLALIKFKVGETYSTQGRGLYGQSVSYKVVSRTDNTVSFAESHISEDDMSVVDDGVNEHKIVIQPIYDTDYNKEIGKTESIVLWEYMGHKGYLTATDADRHSDGWDEEEYEAEDIFEHDDDDSYYTPSSTRGDYSPSAPWNAPGMSVGDFL